LTNYRSINAFSEAQFKTQKYQPDYPGQLDHCAHARTWCESYFDWYNFDHHHVGLAGYTPRCSPVATTMSQPSNSAP
jgi:hypothetical protein